MSELQKKEQEIEKVREQLHQLVLKHNGNLSPSEVTHLSTVLDQMIVDYEKTKARIKNS